jgi:ferric iron reductase protein FhuF
MRTPAEAECVGDGSLETPLPDALHALLQERWPFCCDRIVHDAPRAGDAVRLNGADASRALRDCFERWCRGMPGEDRRGLGSLWTQWYAVTVWPPIVTGILLLGRAPRFEHRETRLVVDEDGCPSGLGIASDARDGDPATLLDRLTDAHAAPLIETVAEATATAPRVPWSNVANVLGWMLSELAAIADEATLAPGYDLLRQRQRPDGRPNPLYLGASRVAAPGRPARRVCCLRYRLSGFGYCGDCPITCR